MKRFLTVLFVAVLILVGTRGVVGAEAQTAVEEPEEMPLGLSIVTAPERVEYYAFDSFSAEGLSVRADYPSGRWELLSPEELCIEYLTDSDRLRYGDSGVYISYRGFRILLPLEVYKREYDISELLFSSVKRTYNGGWQSIEPIGEMPVGLDGIRLSADVSGGGVDVGVYSVSLSFATESRDYRIPEPYNARLEILPHLLAVEWENTEFTYDGSPKLPDAVAKNERGETVAIYAVLGKCRSQRRGKRVDPIGKRSVGRKRIDCVCNLIEHITIVDVRGVALGQNLQILFADSVKHKIYQSIGNRRGAWICSETSRNLGKRLGGCRRVKGRVAADQSTKHAMLGEKGNESRDCFEIGRDRLSAYAGKRGVKMRGQLRKLALQLQ